MTAQKTSPRIYVACLASYNGGILHGEWIDLEGKSGDEINEAVQAMLKNSPEPTAEEWAIHDFEMPYGIKLSETENFNDLAELVEALEEHEEAFGVFYAHFKNDYSDIASAVSDFEDRNHGEWDSLEDYVVDYWEQSGWKADEKASWWHPTNYIDWERMANDLEKSGDITAIEHEGKTYVFTN